MPNEIINSLETVNLKNMTLEGILSNLIGWTLTSGVRLVIGILVIVIGFKIINKVSKKFIDVAEKRNMDMTLVKFVRSFINYSLKILLIAVLEKALLCIR